MYRICIMKRPKPVPNIETFLRQTGLDIEEINIATVLATAFNTWSPDKEDLDSLLARGRQDVKKNLREIDGSYEAPLNSETSDILYVYRMGNDVLPIIEIDHRLAREIGICAKKGESVEDIFIKHLNALATTAIVSRYRDNKALPGEGSLGNIFHRVFYDVMKTRSEEQGIDSYECH